MTPLSKAAKQELEALATALGAIPTARQICDWAKAHPESALQSGFDWDAYKAMEAVRRDWVATGTLPPNRNAWGTGGGGEPGQSGT